MFSLLVYLHLRAILSAIVQRKCYIDCIQADNRQRLVAALHCKLVCCEADHVLYALKRRCTLKDSSDD